MGYIIISVLVFLGIIALSGFRIIRPTHEMLVETFGKWSRTSKQGLAWIIPFVQRGTKINITEQMVDVPEQTVQTSDKLNTLVDAMVYYQIDNAKDSEYNVDNHKRQLTSLARTTLRAVMGNMTLTECIQSREKINTDVEKVLSKETKTYGVNVLRVEVQRIEPPQDVQDAMNEVVKAEQMKIAAKDKATAVETEADGEKRAEIKKAEGIAKGRVIVAKAEAEKIKLVNDSAKKHFVGNAQKLKQLEVTLGALENNTKILFTDKVISPQLIIGELPLVKKK